jgi:hypothetical protein
MTQTKYDKAVSVCFSGHRNIPFLYRKQLKLQLKAAITKAYAGGYRHFYCGCAMGFDMLAAEVALALQSELSGLQVIAVVPYPDTGQLHCMGTPSRHTSRHAGRADRLEQCRENSGDFALWLCLLTAQPGIADRL